MSDDSDYTRASNHSRKPSGYKWVTEAEYVYCDAGGRPLIRAHRQLAKRGTTRTALNDAGKPIKKFGQEYRTAAGDWVWEKPPGAPALPYRLPELLRELAAHPGRTVYVVEGEKKVEALRRWGLTATCNAEGAGKWRSEHAQFLYGADVVVLPDNDAPGRAHAETVGRTLSGRAKRLRRVELPDLPEHGDVVDWIAAGGTRAQLEHLAADAPDWRPGGSDTVITFHGDEEWEAPKWTVYERIPVTGVGLLAGQWGLYKTSHALDLIGAIVTDGDWLGEPVCRRGGVLIIAAEDADSLSTRLRGLIRYKLEPQLKQRNSTLINLQRLPIAWIDKCSPLLSKEALPELQNIAATVAAEFMARFGLELVLIIVDTLAAVAGWKNENDNAENQQAMNVLRELSKATGAFVLAVDHHGKEVGAGPRGGSAKAAAADAIISALGERDPDTGEVSNLRLALFKLRNAQSGRTFAFEPSIVDLGRNEYDRPTTAVIINWDVEPQEQEGVKSPAQLLLEQTIAAAVGASKGNGGGTRPLEATIRKAFGQAYREDKPNASAAAIRQAYKRALKAGQRAGSIGHDREHLWLLEKPADNF